MKPDYKAQCPFCRQSYDDADIRRLYLNSLDLESVLKSGSDVLQSQRQIQRLQEDRFQLKHELLKHKQKMDVLMEKLKHFEVEENMKALRTKILTLEESSLEMKEKIDEAEKHTDQLDKLNASNTDAILQISSHSGL